MFYLASKTSLVSKTSAISSQADLTTTLLQVIEDERLESYGLRGTRYKDGELELRFEAQGYKIILPVRPILHPSRRLLEDARAPRELVLCAHLPEALAADLRQQGVNHADLNGRFFIKTSWFLLDRRPQGTKYRNPDSQRDLFAPKTSRLARTLLARRGQEWTQEQLTTRTGLSRGLVSQCLSQLIEDGIVSRTAVQTRSSPARFVLANFDRLLGQWQQADQWPNRVKVHQYSLLSNDVDKTALKVAEALGGRAEDRNAEGETQVAFTQWYAAHLRHPYTTPPLVSAYVRSERLLDLPLGRKVQSGGNLWLILPEDEGVFQETQDVQGLVLACDVQIYLDLLQVSQRGPEQAEALRTWDGFGR
jgi:hypothetical protein